MLELYLCILLIERLSSHLFDVGQVLGKSTHRQSSLHGTYLCPSFGPLEMDAECHIGSIVLNALYLLAGNCFQMCCSNCLCLVLNFQSRYKHLKTN